MFWQRIRNIIAYPHGWQYPAITEQHAYERVCEEFPDVPDITYIGFPWATVIDFLQTGQHDRAQPYIEMLKQIPTDDASIKITVVQHIYASRYIELFESIGITDLFWPHATINSDTINNIRIHPFPLYPVRCVGLANQTLKPLQDRRCLYSFVGAYDPQFYLSPVRDWISRLPLTDYGQVRVSKEWHFQSAVYDTQILGNVVAPEKQAQLDRDAEEYGSLLSDTVFSLCPSGTGPNSIRLWESLGFGCIPVIISDTLRLPGGIKEWSDAAIFIREDQNAVELMLHQLRELSKDKDILSHYQKAGRKLWEKYGDRNFIFDLIEFANTIHGNITMLNHHTLKKDSGVFVTKSLSDSPSINQTTPINPENFDGFTYSRISHLSYLSKSSSNLLHHDINWNECDLKVYQDLLILNFIRENVPPGSKILEIGGGDSRVLKYLAKEYECWNIDKLEGAGNGPLAANITYFKLVQDYIGNNNEELPNDYFNFVFSISALEHVPENEIVFKNILDDIDRVLKKGGLSLHCFDVAIKQMSVWSNKFLTYIFENIKTLNKKVPFDQIKLDIDSYVMSKNAYERHWKTFTHVEYEDFGQPLSYNVLWTKSCTGENFNMMRQKFSGNSRLMIPPKISIVTPSFNQADYLEECIDSILSQNYPNLEYIIMDGGSTDGSVEIIKKYEKYLTYWQSKPDGGQYAAINEGFRCSTGEIMGWLNSDDKYHPNAFSKLAYLFDTNPEIEWLTGRPTIWHKDGALAYIEPRPPYYSQGKFLAYNYDKPHHIQQESTFWRRSIWNKVGGKLCLDYKLAADLWLWTKFFNHAPIHAVNTMIGGYRLTDANAAILQKDKYDFESIAIIDSEHQVQDPDVYNTKPMPPVIEFSVESFKEYCAARGLVLSSSCDLKCHQSYLSSLTSLAHGHFHDGLYTMELFLRDEFAKLEPSSNPEFIAFNKLITEKAAIAEDVVTARQYADKLLQSGDARRAADVYRTVLDASSLYDDATFGYALCCEANGDYESFLNYLLKTLEINPYHENATVKAVEFYKKQGRINEARNILDNYSTLNPDNSRINQLLAEINAGEVSSIENDDERYFSTDEFESDLWQRDEYLHVIAGELEQNRDLKVLSVDFFDTLICRTAKEPTYVFVELGRRLRNLGLLKREMTPESFRNVRITAEAKSRGVLSKFNRIDTTLEEIYVQLETVLTDVTAAAKVELEVEREFCYLNPSMASLVMYAKRQGLSVIILSDIYLAPEHLLSILIANGLDPTLFDLILTSSTENVGKWNGELFKLAMSRLNLQPHQMLHIGDNFNSDIEGAKSVGVKGIYYPRLDQESFTVLNRERNICSKKQAAGSLETLRLLGRRLSIGNADPLYFRYGAFLLGPVMTLYAAWAVDQYRRSGVKRVCAFMREGDIISKLLKRHAQATGTKMDVNAVYISRQSTHLASLGDLTAESFLGRVDRRSPVTTANLLKSFGLSHEEFGNLAIPPETLVDSSEMIHAIAEYIFQPPVASVINARSKARRKEFVGYIRPYLSEGLVTGIADLGWGGTIQRNFQRILELEGISNSLVGCYLATHGSSSDRLLDGLDIRSFIGEFGAPDEYLSAFLQSPEIVEQLMSAPIGSTLGYRSVASGKMEPVLEELFDHPDEIQHKRSAQQGMMAFQELFLHVAQQKPQWLASPNEYWKQIREEFEESIFPVFQRLISYPTLEEATSMGSIHHDDGLNTGYRQRICSDEERRLLRERGLDILMQKRPYWPQAVIGSDRQELIEQQFKIERFLTGRSN